MNLPIKIYDLVGEVHRLEYALTEDYREAKEIDIHLYKDEYYDDEGNLVFG